VYSLETTTALVTEPIDLTTIKAHLQVSWTNEDTFLTTLGKAARQFWERHTGHVVGATTYTIWLDRWQTIIPLPRQPVTSVTWIKYYDPAGVQQTLDTSLYNVATKGNPARIYVRPSLPSLYLYMLNPIEIKFVAGETTCPELVKQGLLLLVGHWYGNREAVTDDTLAHTPLAFRSIMDQYRTGLTYDVWGGGCCA
jgi:uncharacterized phiE125 gp8 family phage protein